MIRALNLLAFVVAAALAWQLGAWGLLVLLWLPWSGLLPAVRDEVELGEGPDVQLWPHVHGTDAMFFAALRRAAD